METSISRPRRKFLVTPSYTLELEAESPQEAAEMAHQIMQDETPTVFNIEHLAEDGRYSVGQSRNVDIYNNKED